MPGLKSTHGNKKGFRYDHLPRLFSNGTISRVRISAVRGLCMCSSLTMCCPRKPEAPVTKTTSVSILGPEIEEKTVYRAEVVGKGRDGIQPIVALLMYLLFINKFFADGSSSDNFFSAKEIAQIWKKLKLEYTFIENFTRSHRELCGFITVMSHVHVRVLPEATPTNYANPVYGVATICHQVRCLRCGHPSLFHTATSLLIWYKMFCMRDISYRLTWMKFINMLSVYAQSGTHRRVNWWIIAVLP